VGKTSLTRVVRALSIATFFLLLIIIGQVLRTGQDATLQVPANYVPPALTALCVLLVIFGFAAFTRQFSLDLHRYFAWLVGGLSFLFAIVPLAILSFGNPNTAAALYRGLRIPQGIERFWDLALVLRSIDCDASGFNVFVDNNGCLTDAAIYGPGMLWLNHIPFGIFSFSHVLALGVAAMAVSSLCLVWLARQSSGLGQVVLVVSALGAPWLLLLERGNVDVVLIWVAVVGVFIVRRWPSFWVWSLLAVGIWVLGTWKYYPFAMGVMLLPVLRVRRGWIVFVAWVVGTFGYVLLTWSNFRFSMQSNSNMTEIGDYVVLGRVPVVARMVGSIFPSNGFQLGDVLVALLVLCAVAWGVALALSAPGNLVYPSMLGAAGSAVFLASVFIGGFGWAYKAAFLLLCIPLVSSLPKRLGRAGVFAGLVSMALIAVCSVVVWNTLLATLAGLTVAGFVVGFSVTSLTRFVVRKSIIDQRSISNSI
jgi:hypothetical protein